MRWVVLALVSGASLSIAAPRALRSQSGSPDTLQTAKGTCSLWVSPPGQTGVTLDSIYNRCALESGAFAIDPPGFSRFPENVGSLNATLVLVVDVDFKVNLKLTRLASVTLPPAFDEGVYKMLGGWHLAPGSRAGQRVRSASPIVVQVPKRDIPMPALVKWSHRNNRGNAADTLRGTWVTAAPVVPMSEEQIDGIYVATVQELVRTRVVIASANHPYCVSFPTFDSLRARRLNDRLQDVINSPGVNAPHVSARNVNAGVANSESAGRERVQPSYGCHAGDSARRIVLTRASRTEDNRVGLFVSGDFLLLYPRGIYGRTWRSWQAHCSAPVPPTGAQTMHCSVSNGANAADEAAAERERLSPQYVVAPAGGDSIRIRVITLGLGESQTDTMFTTMPLPPRLAEHALLDSGAVCEQGMQAFSAQSARGRYVLWSTAMKSFINRLRVSTDSAPRRIVGMPECPASTSPRSQITAFVLGDVGTRAAEPITMCYFECTERHTIDPARHTLAEHSALTFRPANLRQDGGQYVFQFRIDVDSAPGGVTPLVVFYFDRTWRTAYVPEPFGVNAWIVSMGSDTGGGKDSPADAEVRLYFFRR